MSKVEAVVLNTKPYRPTDYNEKAMQAVLAESYLIADVKKDGVRLNLCVERRSPQVNVEWLSREGKRFPALIQYLQADPRWDKFYNPNLGEALFADSGFMLDAELILLDAEGNEKKCKNISGDLRRKDEPVPLDRIRVYVFDIIPLDAIETDAEYPIQTSIRKMHAEYQVSKLVEIFPEIDWRVGESLDVFTIDPLPAIVALDEDGNELPVETPLSLTEWYNTVRERGEEGLVTKDPLGGYRRSKVSGWWKMVPDDNEDGVIQGLIWGTPGKANEGKVIGFEVLLESGHVVNACKISQAKMAEFTARVEAEGAGWANGFTARVTFMERYPDGSLRHPSFDCFRGISNPLIKE